MGFVSYFTWHIKFGHEKVSSTDIFSWLISYSSKKKKHTHDLRNLRLIMPTPLSSLHRWHLEENQKGWSSSTEQECRMHFPKEVMLQTVVTCRWTRITVEPCHKLIGEKENWKNVDNYWSWMLDTAGSIILFSLLLSTLKMSYNKTLRSKRWKTKSFQGSLTSLPLFLCNREAFSTQLLLQPTQNTG